MIFFDFTLGAARLSLLAVSTNFEPWIEEPGFDD
jgi:hypothetical protein